VLGLHGTAIAGLAEAWADSVLIRHAKPLARLARALLRREALTGEAIDALIPEVLADPAPRDRLIALAQQVATDPAFTWPRPS